jgi:starch synthase
MKARRAAIAPLAPGLDYAHWNPATDVYLQAHYDAEQREGKARNKTRLQQLVQLPVQTQTPLVALAPPLQDLAAALGPALPRLLRGELQVVAPSSGLAPAADAAIAEARERSPRLVSRVEPGTPRWHQVLAGADLVLVDAPRGFEAEPLLAALRYGAVPIVRALGLARDLVVDLTNTLESGSGFLVHADDPAELVAVARRAHAAARAGQPWQQALGRIMSRSCSWEDTAQKLEMIYQEGFRL